MAKRTPISNKSANPRSIVNAVLASAVILVSGIAIAGVDNLASQELGSSMSKWESVDTSFTTLAALAGFSSSLFGTYGFAGSSG